MSSNFPVLAAGAQLPTPPSRPTDLLAWASAITRAIQHMYRTIVTRTEDDLANEQSGNYAPGSRTIAAGRFWIVAGTLRLTADQTVTLKGDALLRII